MNVEQARRLVWVGLPKPRLHWNKVWQCWQVSNPLALPRSVCVMASHFAHQINLAKYRDY